MAARIIKFPARPREPVASADDAEIYQEVCGWMRKLFRDILDGSFDDHWTVGDTSLLKKVNSELASGNFGRPITMKELRKALWRLDNLLVARERLRSRAAAACDLLLKEGSTVTVFPSAGGTQVMHEAIELRARRSCRSMNSEIVFMISAALAEGSTTAGGSLATDPAVVRETAALVGGASSTQASGEPR